MLTKSTNPADHIGFPTILMQFDDSQISNIMENCHVFFIVNDIMKHANIWKHSHTLAILKILEEVFVDIDHRFDQAMSDSDSSREENETDMTYDAIINDD